MMMKGESSGKRSIFSNDDFINEVFSWSLDDILDENLFQDKVCYFLLLLLMGLESIESIFCSF